MKSISKLILLLPIIIIPFLFLIYFALTNEHTLESYRDSSAPTQSSFTTITQKKSWDKPDNKLLKGEKESGEFIADNDNLGIIAIPFNTNNKISNDELLFRIKEKQSEDWYFQSKYSANQFQNNNPYPFGFPIINSSKNKEYYFEVVSLNGVPGDSISISSSGYYLIKYKYSGDYLQRDKHQLFLFLMDKTRTQVSLLSFKNIFFAFLISIAVLVLIFLINKLMKFLLFRVVKFLGALGAVADKLKIFINSLGDFINENKFLVMVLLLLISLSTRLLITYVNKNNAIVAPETLITNIWLGSDFQVGVLIPIQHMLQGKIIYGTLQNYGSAFTLLITPIIFIMDKLTICNLNDVFSCHIFLYRSLLFFTLGGYLLFIFLVSYKKWEMLSFLLLFFIIFVLSTYGTLGIERGNLDIILSLIFGFLILGMFSMSKKRGGRFNKIIMPIIIGIIAGFLVNAKFFLLPFGLVALYSSRNTVVSVLAFFVSFCALGYLPDLLFNSPSHALSAITNSLAFANADFFPYAYRIRYNYSFNALGSLATSCIQRESCIEMVDALTIKGISLFLFLFTFIYPFKNKFKNKIKKIKFSLNLKGFFKLIRSLSSWLIKERFNRRLFLLLLILSTATFILLPESTYSYRLYYVLPIVLLLWRETESNVSARFFCLLSMISLGLLGMWVFLEVHPSGFFPFEPRGMLFFIVLGFYFMIKSGVELVWEKKGKIK